jgi:glycosyltransferase involved in cell wall biosynthesis
VDLSVVIATRNRAGFLDRALASLRDQFTPRSFEVVVADNGSSDATPDVIALWEAKSEHPIRSVFVAEPNRARARNAALALATGTTVLFVDDDVQLPQGFLDAHASAQRSRRGSWAISGPILNVPSYEVRPKPGALNYSGAFFCTCNVSVPRAALAAVGNFDEQFDLYGWEDTELGLRLRRSGVKRAFAWDAYLWHIKPPASETFEAKLRKSVEKGRMAARFMKHDRDWRVALATGGYGANLWRARLTAPEPILPWLAGLAQSAAVPPLLREAAAGTVLDAAYAHELRRGLEGS